MEGELKVLVSWQHGGIVCEMFIRKDGRKKWERYLVSCDIG